MTATRPIADHPSCARPNGRDHRTALTANQTIPAAEVGIDDPTMTAYWLDSTAWQSRAPDTGHAGWKPA